MTELQTEQIISNSSNNDKVFKVLSIDGGGIRGLYSARIIQEFEERFKCQIADYFDLLCGTSTGGLIALGLSLKIPAKDITNLYYNQGDKIFKDRGKLRSSIRQTIWGGKHDNDNLKAALRPFFGNKRLGDSHCLLCIPAFSLTDGRPLIFKYDHPEGGLHRGNSINYLDVALATSAAPTYLPIVQMNYNNVDKQFIDGGVYANNPTLIGVTEALQYFVDLDKLNPAPSKKFNHLMVMSVASLETTAGSRFLANKNLSVLGWGTKLISPFFDGQAFLTGELVKRLADILNFDYLRIPSVALAPEHAETITLDNATQEALDLMMGHGMDQADSFLQNPELKKFFEHQKQYIIR